MSKTLKEWSDICHKIAEEKGFWDLTLYPEMCFPVGRNVGELLMLIVTELSEAMEAHRSQNDEEFKEEIADTFIRLFDLCGGLNINIEREINKKCRKNKKRPYKHGKIC